jgi:hypothetical protein
MKISSEFEEVEDNDEVVETKQPSKPTSEPQKSFIDSGFERLFIPSNGVPYDFGSVGIRPFKGKEIAKLYRAYKTDNFSLVIDAMNDCIDVDVREMTFPDLYYAMIFQRINSYNKSPLKIEWTSMYGNKQETILNVSDVKVNEIKINREEYQKWLQDSEEIYGIKIRIPTVREQEILNIEKLSDDDEWMFRRSQFLDIKVPPKVNHVDYLNKKLESMPLEFFEFLREFREACDHEVVEKLSLTDRLFEKEAAKAYLGKQVEVIYKAMDFADSQINQENMLKVINKIEEIEAEIKAIDEDNFQPKREEVNVDFDITKFFPGI